ncbi:MAG: peptidoglycan DD-metalloendopeptidase family protein [Candidatus Nanopelagicaceae bacterium]
MITAIVRAGAAISKGSKLLPRSAAASKPVLASKSVKLAPSYPKVDAPKRGNGLVKRLPDALDFASSFTSSFSDTSGTDTPKQSVKTKNCCDTLIPLVDSISKKLVDIDKLLKDELKFDRKDSDYQRKKKEKGQYKKQEEKLETPKKVKPKSKLSPSAPGISLGERIKRFVMFTLLGWLVDKILPLLPKLIPVFNAVGKVINFGVELFGGLVSGLSKFLEFGIKLTNGLTKSLGFIAGARTEQEFSDFEKKFNRMVDLAILAAMLIGDSGGDLFGGFGKGRGKGGKPSTSRPRPGTGGRSKVTTSGGKSASKFGRIKEKFTDPFRKKSKVTTSGGRETGLGGRLKDLKDKVTRPTTKVTTSGGKTTGILGKIEDLGTKLKKTISPTKITGAPTKPGLLKGTTESAKGLLASASKSKLVQGATGVFSKIKVPPAVGKAAGPVGTVLFAGVEYGGRKAAGQTTSQAAIGTGASVAGGLAGAAGGAQAGAAIGAAIGLPFAGVGAVPGAAIGGIIGGILGGLGGSWAASSVADAATGANKAKPAPAPVAKHNEGGIVKNTLDLKGSLPSWFESANKKKASTKSSIKINLPKKKKAQSEKPGKDIGGFGEITKLFPDPEGKVSGTGSSQGGAAITSAAQKKVGFNIFNPFSWFSKSTSGSDASAAPAQPSQGSSQPNALFALTKASQSLKRIPFVGYLMGAAVDIVMGQKPDRDLYQTMADSVLYLGQKAAEGQSKDIQSNIQKLATGGIASIAESSSSISLDAGKVATKTLRDSLAGAIEMGANSALKNIKDEIVSADVKGNTSIATKSLEPPNPNEGAPTGDPSGTEDGSQTDDPLVPGAPSGSTPQVSGGNADFWTLVAIASREDSEPQSWADVAQSIYNRAAVGMYTGGKNIKAIITASGQYEPTFGNRAEWLAISDINTASKAAKKSVNQLKQVAAALKNPTLQAEAARFVGGRTDFMGESQKKSMRTDKGDVTRGPGDNYFGWFYNAKLKGPAKAPNLGDVAVTGGGSSNKPGSGKPGSNEPVKPSGSKSFPLPKGVVGTGSGQVFGAPRSYGPHAGVDVVERPPWQSDPKIPVVSYSGGKVIQSSPGYSYKSSGYTSNLSIDHGGGLKATYLHMSPGLRVGDNVSAGQKIGKLIDLGDQTHLHFQAYKDNKLVNPTGLLRGVAFHGTEDTKKGGLYLTHPNEAIVDKDTVSLLGKDFFKTLNNVENKASLSKVAPDLIARINEVARGKAYSMGEPETQDIESGDPSLSISAESTQTTQNLEQFNKQEETKTEESQQNEEEKEDGKKQRVQVTPASHPQTGSGFTIKGVTDGNGRPLILSKGGIKAFGEMMQDSKGAVKGSDVASGKRSPAHNKKVGGVPNSNHLGGNALDIHGTSEPWMRRKGKAYGWIVNDYPGSHGGHFDYKGKNADDSSDTFAARSADVVDDSVTDYSPSGGGPSGGGPSGGGPSGGRRSRRGGGSSPEDGSIDVDAEPSESLVPGAPRPKGGKFQPAAPMAKGAVGVDNKLFKEIGASAEDWDIFRNTVAHIESKGAYDIAGGSGGHYDGRYQMGADAKTDAARVLGIPDPGHNSASRAAYRNKPELQEKMFAAYTIANHRYLMRNKDYKNASVERKLQILGYAHNQGMGGAEKWLKTGEVGADGFGTKGTKYTDALAANFKARDKAIKDGTYGNNDKDDPSNKDHPGSTKSIAVGNYTIDTKNAFLKSAGTGKLEYGEGGDGYCTTNVLKGLDKVGHTFAPQGTAGDSSNPRGLVSQLIGGSGFTSIPGLGTEQTIKSPYGNVKARVVPFKDYQAAVEKGLIPSGAFLFSTRYKSWNQQTGGSSGFDTAIAREGGRIAWNGTGSQGNAIYGDATQSVIVLVPKTAIKENPNQKPGEAAKPGTPAVPGSPGTAAKPGTAARAARPGTAAKPGGKPKQNWLQSAASNVFGLLTGKKKLGVLKAEGGGQIDPSGIITRPKAANIEQFASYEDPSGPAPHIIIIPSPAKQQSSESPRKGASPSFSSPSKSSNKYYSPARRK